MERYLARGLGDRQEIYSSAEDVYLRSFAPEDADKVIGLIQLNPEHFISVGEGKTVDNYQTSEDFLRRLDQSDTGRVRYGIWSNDQQGRELVGSINYELIGERVVVGYWVSAEHTGHAYAARALRTLVRHLLQSGYQDICADVRVDNVASRKTAESSGFIASPWVDEFNYVEYRFQTPTESAA